MFNKDDVINTIEAKKDEIKSLGIIKLSIFGSLVRNEQNENSDIDLLVEFDGSQSYFRIIKAQQEIEKYLGRKVDLVTEDAISIYFKDKVLREMETVSLF